MRTVHFNSMRQLCKYFLGEWNSTTFGEFKDFWLPLTQEEREYYKSIDLKTGKPCAREMCTFHFVDF